MFLLKILIFVLFKLLLFDLDEQVEPKGRKRLVKGAY